MKIEIWDRKKQILTEEPILSEKIFRFLHENNVGYKINQTLLVRPAFNKFYGFLQDLPRSRKKIPGFINNYNIDMKDFEPKIYKSFNDFFKRKFKDHARKFVDTQSMPAICEGRVLAFDSLSKTQKITIKNTPIDIQTLVPAELSRTFANGPVMIYRLSPFDYHHFHFPDDGIILSHKKHNGFLNSVSPISLAKNSKVFLKNKRSIYYLQTQNFSELLVIAIGGFCVGRIQQTHAQKHFSRGDTLGHFEFGGSTVILIGQENAWRPDVDLLERSQKSTETLVQLGEKVGGVNT